MLKLFFAAKPNNWSRPIRFWLAALVVLTSIFGQAAASAAPAKTGSSDGDATVYIWWLVRWENNQVACSLSVAHEGPPTANEIELGCGTGLLYQWQATPYCAGSSASCTGLYLHLATRIQQRTNLRETVYTRPSWVSTASSVGAMELLSYGVDPETLASSRSLLYLAGRMIKNGMIAADDCPGGGLLPSGAANRCGEARAQETVVEWQNQFDEAIIQAAEQTQVPPRLLKNLFVQESQLWPGIEYSLSSSDEFGLGHMTEAGADTLLTWNTAYFKSLCVQMLGDDACESGYVFMPAGQRAILRGIVLRQVGAECRTCPWGVDLRQAQKSVPIFAHVLVAYAEQTGQVIYNVTNRKASEVTYREDLWRFTLANYNAGSACLGAALQATREQSYPLDWPHVAQNFPEGCQQAVEYVNKISNVEAPASQLSVPSGRTASLFERWQQAFDPAYINPAAVVAPAPAPTQAVAMASADNGNGTSAGANDIQGDYAVGEVLVKLDGGQLDEDALQSLGDSLGVAISVKGEVEGLDTVVLNVPAGSEGDVLAALQQNPVVASVEPNYVAQTFLAPGDPNWGEQTYLLNVQLPQAWDVTTGASDVVVAVIDTGVDVAHPDLAAKIWQNPGEVGQDADGNDKRDNGLDDDGNGLVDDWQGWNFVSQSNNVQDDQGHGSYVSGAIGAEANNGVGMAGVSWGAQLMILKALDSNGFGTYSQIADAIVYAVDNGAQIINLSLGNTADSDILRDAVDYAAQRGVTIVAAAGNSGTQAVYYPAAYPEVISVAAVDSDNQRASFSTSDGTVDLAAPGVNIFTTGLNGGYGYYSGTSMAAAHVSGAAALLLSMPQFDTPDEIRAALDHTALDLGAAGRDDEYGHGLMQVYDALNFDPSALPTPTPPPTATPATDVTPSPTATPGGPTPTPTPSATPTPWSAPAGGVNVLASEGLWGTAQSSSYTIQNPANSLDQAFNDVLASATGNYGPDRGDWTFTDFQNTNLSTVVAATLYVRYYATGWVNDFINLEISNDNGNNWYTFASIGNTSPPTTLTTVAYDLSSYFTTPGEVNAAQFRFRGNGRRGSTDTVTFYIDEVQLAVADVTPTPTPLFPPLPTPTAPVPAPTNVPIASDPHVDYNATTSSCAACHRGHTATGIVLRQQWPEENVCFTCHTSGGTGTDVQPAFTGNTNTATGIFKHAISGTNGVHRLGQTTGASFGGANRHIECEDCHEPHEATRGAANAPMLQRVMNASPGVDPAWTTSGAPTSYTWMPQAEREYQVCFKCHSSFTTLPSYQPDGWDATAYVANGLAKLTSTDPVQIPDSRDLAQEFNPYNTSFHPVAAQGRNQNIPADSFVASSGMSQTSLIYCSSCHNNVNAAAEGVGPHGSPRLHILLGLANYTTVDTNGATWVSSDEVCFQCHRYDVYASDNADTYVLLTNFRNGTRNMHRLHVAQNGERASCYVCHDSHGSEQEHLINFEVSAAVPLGGRDSQSAWYPITGGGGGCYISCHGRNHWPRTYRP